MRLDNVAHFSFSSIAADWRYRYAGLMTLSSTAEGAHKQMEAYLDQMVDGIVGFLKDPVSHLYTTPNEPRLHILRMQCQIKWQIEFILRTTRKFEASFLGM